MREPSHRLSQGERSRRTALKALAAGAGAIAMPGAFGATPATPLTILGKGYRLVENWDFGSTITDLVALRAAWMEGRSTEDAIAIGKTWGLKGLEGEVRRRIEAGLGQTGR